jgi:hypothetical protein
VTYSGSTKKLAERGGFAHDDTNVMMLLSNPSLRPHTVTIPVTTMQVAPTILKELGLDRFRTCLPSKIAGSLLTTYLVWRHRPED